MNNIGNDKVKIEALLNEYKGNLFEYLVAHFLAKEFSIESQFLSCVNLEYRNRLAFYERQIKKIAPELIILLQKQAISLGKKLLIDLPDQMDSIWVIGKANCQLDLGGWNEADILMKNGVRVYPVSVKLCKASSYINTKSGGTSSFIQKYFSEFDNASAFQNEFNKILEINFSSMRNKLYNEAGISDNSSDFNIWKKSGFPELSGSLPQNLQTIVVDSYAPLNDYLYKTLEKFFLVDKKTFFRSLGPILGLSSKEMIQAILFHAQNSCHGKQVEKKCVIFKLSEFEKEMESINFRNSDAGKGYFYLDFDSLSIQIRIKPMNKFTSKSYKINCSIKHKK